MFGKVKSIKQIYEEVKDFDLVITNDAPLATALNNFVDKPRLGILAMTPRQIASDFAELYLPELMEKHDVILNISRHTKYPLKLIHGITEKIFDVWMHNAKLEFAEQFLSGLENKILELVNSYCTIETAIERFNEEFYGDKKIAVISEDLFTLLDMEVLPRRTAPAHKINVFEEKEFHIDNTYLFTDTNELIDTVANLISKDSASETAIVLSPDSEYLELLKIRLIESGIEIDDKKLLSSDLSVRKFISFIEFSLNYENAYVSDFKPVAFNFGFNISSGFDNYNLESYLKKFDSDPELKKLYSLSEKVTALTFLKLIEHLQKDFSLSLSDEFRNVLEMLGIAGNKISNTNLESLKYFLKEIDIELKNKSSGVLLVNSLNSAFIDRQLIFYIGLDISWMRLFPDKDYLNKDEEEIKNLKRFSILLQQGSQRFYFAKSISDYREIIPCYYFSQLFDKKIENFLDEVFNPVAVPSGTNANNFLPDRKVSASIPELPAVKALSPSRFREYFTCPKIYSLNPFITDSDNINFLKGNLVHQFAELYFNHPDFVKKNIDKIIGIMTDELMIFGSNVNKKYYETIFLVASENVIEFIDNQQIKKISLSKPADAEINSLMEMLDKKKIYLNTEYWLPDVDRTMIRGKCDLQYGDSIVDYKTSGKRKAESAAAMQSNLAYIRLNETTDFDFQAIAYITAFKKKSEELIFMYNFLLSNIADFLNNTGKEKSTLTTIKFLPVKFRDFLLSDTAFELISLKNNGTKKLLQNLGYENYKSVISGLNIADDEFYVKSKVENEVSNKLIDFLNKNGMSYKDFGSKKQDAFLKSYILPVGTMIYNIRTGNLQYGIIFEDDTDNFSSLLKNSLIEINEFSKSSFPFRPVFNSREVCKICMHKNICIGNKLWNLK